MSHQAQTQAQGAWTVSKLPEKAPWVSDLRYQFPLVDFEDLKVG